VPVTSAAARAEKEQSARARSVMRVFTACRV
jgi:hypothetical protein